MMEMGWQLSVVIFHHISRNDSSLEFQSEHELQQNALCSRTILMANDSIASSLLLMAFSSFRVEVCLCFLPFWCPSENRRMFCSTMHDCESNLPPANWKTRSNVYNISELNGVFARIWLTKNMFFCVVCQNLKHNPARAPIPGIEDNLYLFELELEAHLLFGATLVNIF